MIDEIFLDKLTDIGLEVGKSQINKKLNEQLLRNKLKKYISEQKKLNGLYSMKEEFDFEGLLNYILNHLITDVQTRVFSINTVERGRARKEVIDKAIKFSKANTKESINNVKKIVATSIDIIKSFYSKNISLQNYIIASDIFNNVTQHIDNKFEELGDKLKCIDNKIIIYSQFSQENLPTLVAENKIELADSILNNCFPDISKKHVLYPDYGYTYTNDGLISVPLTQDAEQKYPSSMNVRADIKIGDNIYHNKNTDPFEFAYRHQKDMFLKVIDATKMLGNVKDPIQKEAKKLVGQSMMIKPKEFPPAFPCSIVVGGIIYFDYILFRTTEILDDGTYIVSNKEQKNTNIYFEVRFKMDGDKRIDFETHIKKPTCKERLNYSKFIKDIQMKKELGIYMLNEHRYAMKTQTENDLKVDVSEIDAEIDFFARLCLIEDYFSVRFKLPEKIETEDSKLIYDISNLIRNNKKAATWENKKLTICVGINPIDIMNKFDNPICLAEEGDYCLELFGEKLKYHYRRVFKSAKLKDFERKCQIMNLLTDDEKLDLVFMPYKDNTFYEYIDRID